MEDKIRGAAIKHADNKFTNKAKNYSEGSSIKAVYENCISDFIDGAKWQRQSSVDLDEVKNNYFNHIMENDVSLMEAFDFFAPLIKWSDWISVEDRLPICTESGNWDGKRSGKVLVLDFNGNHHEAILYSGILDGSEFNDFYSIADYEITATHWQPLPQSPTQTKK